MSDIKITGGKPLSGRITPSGNKNSVLPMLAATILTGQPIQLNNVPDIIDVEKMIDLFKELNSKIVWDKKAKTLKIDNSQLSLEDFGGNLPLGMRASILLLAPLLARFGKISIDFSIGGCTLGIRDIDPHIHMLQELGAEVERENGRLNISLTGGSFSGGNPWTDYVGVTATENALMAAVLAKGATVIYNAAAEPHVQNLAEMLTKMGAKLEGVGSNRLTVTGVDKLDGAEVDVWSDHHEITTFLALGAISGGRVEVENALPEHFTLINNAFAKLGVEITYDGDTAVVEKSQSFEPAKGFTRNMVPKIEAAPWPYFPVDLLPLMIALSLKTKGPMKFWNKIYEGGLFWVTELVKMGATIEISDPHRVIVFGPTPRLQAATLECPYIIRATVALMMAAIAAEGTSYLKNIDSVHRAHPNFVENMKKLGAEMGVVNP